MKGVVHRNKVIIQWHEASGLMELELGSEREGYSRLMLKLAVVSGKWRE